VASDGSATSVGERSEATWAGLVLAAASVLLAILVSGLYANAIVSAGTSGARRDCGTVWEPDAGTSDCAAALTSRAWTATGLLGAALVGALVAVVVAGSARGAWRRQIALAAAAAGVLVILCGVIWSGVIDRTVGS